MSLVGLSIAAACSDDNGGTSGDSQGGGGGDAGQNGETPGKAGKGGTGNDAAGKPTTGGTMVSMNGGMAGALTAGEGGKGGEPFVATLGEACTTCGAAECADTMASCSDSAECTAWLACVTACDSTECVTACDKTHVDAVRVYAGVYDCLCDSCEADCSGAKACDKKTCVDEHPLAAADVAPANLAETGLYALVGGEVGAGGEGGMGGAGGAPGVELALPIEIASYVRTYQPKYPLWADGATKDRYVYIPKCATIDTVDMDHWRFPVGTRFWKTFTAKTSVGAVDTVVETRLLHHFGPGEADWVYAAYQWDVNKPGDPSAALLVPAEGVVNANGTDHNIPPQTQCQSCHSISEKALGFSAIQLSHAGQGLAMENLSNLGWLTEPAPDGFPVPGTAVEQAALGYLHGNCGGCHRQGVAPGGGPANGSVGLDLRLLTSQRTVAATDTFKTAVGILVGSGNQAIAGKARIAAKDAANSAILIRMAQAARGTSLQMPPLGTSSTKLADTEGGIKAVTDWVGALPQ